MKNSFWKKIINSFLNSVITNTVKLSSQENSKIDLSINEVVLNSYIDKINDLIIFNKKLLEFHNSKLLSETLKELNNIIYKKDIKNLVKKIIYIQRQLDTTWCSLNGIGNS